jgi:hypothetical protein
MLFRRREKWLEKRFANVDGIPFQMPVRTLASPAMFAAFSIDAKKAKDMLPGEELHPFRLFRRGILVLAVVDYKDTTIGKYVEFCIGILCTRGRKRTLPLAPLLLTKVFGTGVYIYDLPVSTEISVKGGLGIWGMPKRRANLDFVIGQDVVSSQYDLDGHVVMRIDVPRNRAVIPFRMRGVGYGAFRGLLTKSYIGLRGRMALAKRDGVRLLVGDHPRCDPLKHLDINPKALFAGFVPSSRGILEDHIETWYLTGREPMGVSETGLKDVVDLGLSEEWLPPPNRELTDRLLAQFTPAQRIGKRTSSLSTDSRSPEEVLA